MKFKALQKNDQTIRVKYVFWRMKNKLALLSRFELKHRAIQKETYSGTMKMETNDDTKTKLFHTPKYKRYIASNKRITWRVSTFDYCIETCRLTAIQGKVNYQLYD